jgi:hypothetical protein
MPLEWNTLHTPPDAEAELPRRRGSAILFLAAPFVKPGGRFRRGRMVHFSWENDSFRIRDFIENATAKEADDVKALTVWQAAKGERVLCTGELRRPVTKSEFWKGKLEELTCRYYAAQGWTVTG